jgi:hypothetical protein
MTATLTRIPARRAAFGLAAIGLALSLGLLVAAHGHWPAALTGLLAPDLALLAGAGSGLERGQIHPRGVGVYNAAHRVWGPLVLTTLGATGILGLGWLVLGLAWATHVAVDRVAGYGLRDARGFQRDA